MQKKIADYLATAVERQGVKQQRLMDISEKESHIKDLQVSSVLALRQGTGRNRQLAAGSSGDVQWGTGGLTYEQAVPHSCLEAHPLITLCRLKLEASPMGCCNILLVACCLCTDGEGDSVRRRDS